MLRNTIKQGQIFCQCLHIPRRGAGTGEGGGDGGREGRRVGGVVVVVGVVVQSVLVVETKVQMGSFKGQSASIMEDGAAGKRWSECGPVFYCQLGVCSHAWQRND